jgi:streptothricin acetyltransferase
MDIVVRKLTGENLGDLTTCESEFLAEERLVPRIENGRLAWTTEPVPPFRKRYDPGDIDGNGYIADPERVGFLAYADGATAGQLLLRRNWNHFALIDDIRVDPRFRRRGVGRALLAPGAARARRHDLTGLMPDTQDTNVPACRFYEACGFVLAGFDRLLYHASTRHGEETALFWYLVFTDVPPTP